MTTARNLTIAAAAVGLVLVAGTANAGTHHSLSAGSDNRMTFGEWYNISEGESQHNVEAAGDPSATGDLGCDCVGTKIRDWVGGDQHARKWVQYADTDPYSNVSIIQYRLTADGVWHTDKVKWFADDGDAEPFYYGVPTF